MPTYCYRCRDCKRTFEVRHGMFFEKQKCIFCYSGDLFRIPQGSLSKKSTETSNRPGKIVDKFIKDAKEEVKKEKKKLKLEEM